MDIKEVIGLNKRFVIGMVHCLPLLGTPGFDGDCSKIIQQAVADAKTLEKAGVDAIIVENMGDGPFNDILDMEQRINLAVATQAVKDAVKVPVGVDAAFNDCKAALAIAKTAGCTFVRIPVLVDTVLINGGQLLNPCGRECAYYRAQIDAKDIMILADVQVKHAKLVYPDITIEQSAKTAVECGADAIIVTGSVIGEQTPIEMIERVKNVVKVPVIAGSGVNPSNIDSQLHIADGAIVGSSLKEGGKLENPISYELTKELLDGLNK